MLQLVLPDDFKHQVLQWYGVTVPMKEPSGLLGEIDTTSRDMREVVMKTEEPVSTRDANERLVKIIESTYAKSNLGQVAINATQMSSEERTQIIRILQDYEELFDGNLGDWGKRARQP